MLQFLCQVEFTVGNIFEASDNNITASEYETRSAEAADLDSDVTRCLAGFKRSDDIANDGVSRCLAGFRRDAETVNDDVSRCLAGFKREEDTAEYDSTVSRCFAGF